MSKFILVHDASADASPVLLNSNNIAYAEKSELLTGATYIQLNDLDMNTPSLGYHVTETPEQLFEMLK
jgi:hypothetical protein